MTAVAADTPQTFRSGVIIAFPRAAMRSDILALSATFETEADRFAAASGTNVAVFGFDSTIGETAVAVSHIGPKAVDARPDVAMLLGEIVADAVRIDSYVTASAPQCALRAEVLLLRLARAIANAHEGLICDDVGAIYDPAEIDDLVAAGAPREKSLAFVIAAASRVENLIADEVSPMRLGDIDGTRPSECAPDIALVGASIYVVMGSHVPLVTATRIAFTASDAMPTIVLGPNLLARDVAVLEAAGITVVRSSGELEARLEIADARALRRSVPPSDYGRDELVFFRSSDMNGESVRTALARRALDVADLAASGARDQPTIGVLDERVSAQSAPTRVARFAYPGTVVDFYTIDLNRAHPLLVALLAVRPEIASLLGAAPTVAIICEMLARDETSVAAADAFVISSFADFASDAYGILQDDAGALYDQSDLVRLSTARRGHRDSWAERVALARLSMGIA